LVDVDELGEWCGWFELVDVGGSVGLGGSRWMICIVKFNAKFDFIPLVHMMFFA
jgi:hypothetical protein